MSNQLILPMEAYKAKLDQMYKTTNEFKWVSHLVETEKRLQELSDKLSLVLIETGEAALQMPGTKANYWHVQYKNDPPSDPSFFPVQNEDGSPAEPGQWLVDRFWQNNVKRPGRLEELRKNQEEVERRKAKEEEAQSEENVEEMFLRYKAMKNPSYHFGTKNWRNKLAKVGK